MAESTISLKMAADVSSAASGIQKIASNLDDLKSKVSQSQTSFTSFATGLASARIAFDSVAKVVSTLAGSVSALVSMYAEQERAELRLQTTLQATQNACGMTAAELFELAEAFSEVTTYASSDIIAIEQILAATQTIGRDVMPDATKAVLNLAAATGRNATQAAQQLARALSDPTKNINALNSAGITLTSTQQENIKTIQEQSGLYEAQRAILDHIAETYGDMAEAIANTDSGKLEQIGNVWSDIKQGLASGLMNSISPALDTLYEQLLKIKNLVDEWNDKQEMRAGGEDGSFSFLSSMSNQELQNILDGSYYYQAYKSWNGKGLLEEWIQSYYGGMVPMGTYSDASLVRAVLAELEERNKVVVAEVEGTMEWRNFLASIKDVTEDLEDMDEALEEAVDATASTADTSLSDSLSKFISSNKSLSVTAQISAIDSQLREMNSYFGKGIMDAQTVEILSEVRDKLLETRAELEEIKKKGKDVKKSFDWTDVLSDVTSQVTSIVSSVANIFSTLSDSAKEALEDIEDYWDDYFEELEDKQERQALSYSALLASGNMSYEEYINAMNSLDEARAEAQAEQEAEEEAAREKANSLGQAAFVAEQMNAIASVGISTAQAVMQAWATYASNPTMAGVMIGLISAAAATQIAAISSQSYTPIAAGGIVTSPTQALIGEGGSPELVLPLTEGNLAEYGLNSSGGSGVINITIQIENSYSGDQLAEDVFRGIERAQRTGALPSWRYS